MIQVFEIKNDHLSVQIKRKGAELCSVIDNSTGHEFIWQAAEVWPRHAPILFPIVGSLLDHEYIYNDKIYQLSHHGFARDMNFEMLHQSEHSIALILSSTAKTLNTYPFSFDLLITYTLKGNQLEQRFRVINNGEELMPVSFGAHPAFNANPISDFYIEFEQDEKVRSNHLSVPYIDDSYVDVIEGNRIELNESIFNEDALIFEGLRSSYLTLKHRNKKLQIKVNFADFPYMGIWAKPAAPYVCIEPWQGLADQLSHNKQILEKKGIFKLVPNMEISKSFTMEFIS